MTAICEVCGRGRFACLSGIIKFKDKKYICCRCLKQFGQDHPLRDASILALRTTEDILHPELRWQNQAEENARRYAAKYEITPAQFSALDKANATEFEMKLFSRICAILDDELIDTQNLIIESGQNGSLLVLKDDVVLLEYKGEPNLKWIILSDNPGEKIRFGQLSRLNALADRIVELFKTD